LLTEIRDHAKDVADAMPELRNDPAHGTTMLNMEGRAAALIASRSLSGTLISPTLSILVLSQADSEAKWRYAASR